MDRRAVLKSIVGLGGVALAACSRASEQNASPSPSLFVQRMPLVFLAHGAITGFWNDMPFTKRSVQIA